MMILMPWLKILTRKSSAAPWMEMLHICNSCVHSLSEATATFKALNIKVESLALCTVISGVGSEQLYQHDLRISQPTLSTFYTVVS